MRFSIIIPVYNAGSFLEQCLKSILNQNFSDYEIVLVDDGSNDASSEICDKYSLSDGKVKVLHQPNQGVVCARKNGVNIANGDYLLFIDSDDFVAEKYLIAINSIIEQHNPDIVMFDYYYGNNNRWRAECTSIQSGNYNRDRIVEEIYPHLICDKFGKMVPPMLWGKAIRKQLYKKCQLLDSRVVMGEDSACIIPVFYHAHSFYMLHENLYFYRVNSQSVTHSKKVYPENGPLLRADHIKKLVNIDEFDFKYQISRMIVLSVSTVVISKYNDKKRYFTVNREIDKYLDSLEIREALRNCHFEVKKNSIAS